MFVLVPYSVRARLDTQGVMKFCGEVLPTVTNSATLLFASLASTVWWTCHIRKIPPQRQLHLRIFHFKIMRWNLYHTTLKFEFFFHFTTTSKHTMSKYKSHTAPLQYNHSIPDLTPTIPSLPPLVSKQALHVMILLYVFVGPLMNIIYCLWLTLQEYAAAGTVKQNYANILLMLLRLRQACDHPLLVKGYHSDSVGEASIEMARKLPREMLISFLGLLEASLAICGVCSVRPYTSRILFPLGICFNWKLGVSGHS